MGFDANGDMLAPPVTIMRVQARDGVSDVPTYEGAEIVSVITPRPDEIRRADTAPAGP